MGKKSGITKSGRMMNPADRERKQLRAKELKRNKKQRTQVRHAIVKGRDPDELIEAMSRLDDQEYDPQRQLSLNVIQEKRNKLRGSYYQIVGLFRQEKEEKKVKNLERMMFEYEVERARKEENFRAQMFSASADFDEIPLPCGASDPEAAKTPLLPGGAIGPQMPAQLQVAMKAGILKKPTAPGAKKKHKYPPGPPPGLPPQLFDDSDDEEDDNDEGDEDEGREWEEERRGGGKRVRFGGEEPSGRRRRRGRDEEDEEEGYGEEEEEDYAPVEIPDGLLEHHQQQPVYSRPVPSLAAPAIGSGPIMPGMAPPPPAYPPGYHPMHGGAPGERPPPRIGGGPPHAQMAPPMHPANKMMGMVNNYGAAGAPPPDPHPSAIISAEPQVVMPTVSVLPPGGPVISAAPQMRNMAREATRFVPTAVKVGRSVVQSVIGPRVPTTSIAGPTKLVPRSTATAAKRMGATQQQGAGKSVDQACDDFLKELEGLL